MAATRSPSNMSRIRDFALGHKHFTLQDVMSKVPGLTKKQIHGAIGNLRHTGQVDLEIVTPGQDWQWSSDTWARISNGRWNNVKADKANTETNNIFELLATTKMGALILQDAEGNLFKAERL